MLTIINSNTDPRYNLAVEEYVFKYLNLEEDFLLIWQNEKSVIIGKDQNPFNEINGYFINKNHIPVIRRTTNGQAIYHDDGIINYALVTNLSNNNNGNHQIFLEPVVDALNGIGIKAHINNKSNLYVGKDKISLDYQNVYNDKVIHRGIIFVDSNLNYQKLVNNLKTIDVVNVKKYFTQSMTVSMFRVLLLHELLKGEIGKNVYTLDYLDKKRINQLVEKKYADWDWNYGESGEFLIKKEYDNRISITLIIARGFIKDVTLDSFENTIKLEKALMGVKLSEESLRKALSPFKDIDIDNMIDTIMY